LKNLGDQKNLAENWKNLQIFSTEIPEILQIFWMVMKITDRKNEI